MAALRMTSMCLARNVKHCKVLGYIPCMTSHNLSGQTHLQRFHANTNSLFINNSPFQLKTWCCNRTLHTSTFRLRQSEQSKGASTESENKSDGEEKKDDKPKGPTLFGKQYSWKRLGLTFLGVYSSGLLICAIVIYGAPKTDEEGRPVEDQFSHYPSPLGYMLRFVNVADREVKLTREPSREKLLPDPLKYPYYQPKYTLVVEMTDVLVHPEWTYGKGWRFKKRPGIDHFLRSIGPPLFEVVVYTKEQGMTADPIITKIDPENYIMYRLYRDTTRYIDGQHVKDLSYLNRDLSKVIMLDWDKSAYKLNPENGLQLKRWQGEEKDLVLGEVAEFLKAIAVSKVEDVRPVLQYYSQFEDPLAQFRQNQRKLREEQERQVIAQKQKERQRAGFWSLK